MPGLRDTPLSVLLSQAFVVWTIEVDNLVEATVPHRTSTAHDAGEVQPRGPWLTSVAMYWTCLRSLPDEGATLAELTGRTGMGANLNGLRRWGYVTVDGAPAGRAAIRPRPTSVLRPTEAGWRMRAAWLAALTAVERRWRQRFGARAVDALVTALDGVDRGLDRSLPDGLPILGYGLSTAGLVQGVSGPRPEPALEPRLPIALARVLLAFLLEVDAASPVPAAIGENLLRVLDEAPAPVRELSGRGGVSPEAIRMALGVAAKRGWVGSVPGSPPSVRRTAAGSRAWSALEDASVGTEAGWISAHGEERVAALRAALAALVEPVDGTDAPIRAGLATPHDGWRAREPDDRVLPHAPMVLHRGGWPDGA